MNRSPYLARRKELEITGRVWLRNAVSDAELHDLLCALPKATGPGLRIPATTSLYDAVTRLPALTELRATWPGMRPVRMVYFDKAGQNNWSLPWHQDRVIALRDRAELPGYKNWTRKQGDWHCEPPRDILDQMLFVRLHLDPNTAENGAMEIAPGSHRFGKLSADKVAATVAETGTEITLAEAGMCWYCRCFVCTGRAGAADSPSSRAAD